MNPINLNRPADAEAARRQQRAELGTSAETRQSSQPGVVQHGQQDKLNVSNRGAAVGGLVEKVRAIPDIRRERVEALRQQVEKGEYNPPAADIAAAIMRDED
jgi:flagellar biosynthesis anti-sigma factor FlgM